LEYALLVSVLCAVFVTMFMYLKNAVTSRIYVTQERVNEAVR
jgi:Flp pilus assembly pilin Flp